MYKQRGFFQKGGRTPGGWVLWTGMGVTISSPEETAESTGKSIENFNKVHRFFNKLTKENSEK